VGSEELEDLLLLLRHHRHHVLVGRPLRAQAGGGGVGVSCGRSRFGFSKILGRLTQCVREAIEGLVGQHWGAQQPMEGGSFALWNVGYTLSQRLHPIHLRQGLQRPRTFLVDLAMVGTKFPHCGCSILWGAESGLELCQVSGCGSAVCIIQNRDDGEKCLALSAPVWLRDET
jgi:hypothetical protein